jgi:hypothetical protein
MQLLTVGISLRRCVRLTAGGLGTRVLVNLCETLCLSDFVALLRKLRGLMQADHPCYSPLAILSFPDVNKF